MLEGAAEQQFHLGVVRCEHPRWRQATAAALCCPDLRAFIDPPGHRQLARDGFVGARRGSCRVPSSPRSEGFYLAPKWLMKHVPMVGSAEAYAVPGSVCPPGQGVICSS
jgi:hypothetical protein